MSGVGGIGRRVVERESTCKGQVELDGGVWGLGACDRRQRGLLSSRRSACELQLSCGSVLDLW